MNRQELNPVESSAKFVSELASLASRLAASDLVVASIDISWRSFGSWGMELQRGSSAKNYYQALAARNFKVPGPDVLSLSWDGKERYFSARLAPTEPLSSPGPWRTLVEHAFNASEEALRFAEDYAVKWARSAV